MNNVDDIDYRLGFADGQTDALGGYQYDLTYITPEEVIGYTDGYNAGLAEKAKEQS